MYRRTKAQFVRYKRVSNVRYIRGNVVIFRPDVGFEGRKKNDKILHDNGKTYHEKKTGGLKTI